MSTLLTAETSLTTTLAMVTPTPTPTPTMSSLTILPLTTTFTAPTSCFSTITRPISIDYGLTLGCGAECIPSGAPTAERTYAFSPGFDCPHSYTTAWLTREIIGTATESRAICCPRLDGILPLSGLVMNYNPNTAGRSWYSTLGCTVAFSQPVALTVLQNGISTMLSFPAGEGLNAYSVQIAWQTSDLSVTSSTIYPTIPSTTASPTLAVSTSFSISSDDLSTNSKIAWGIVLPLGGAFLTFLLVRNWWRKRSLNGEGYSGSPVVLVEEQHSVSTIN